MFIEAKILLISLLNTQGELFLNTVHSAISVTTGFILVTNP